MTIAGWGAVIIGVLLFGRDACRCSPSRCRPVWAWAPSVGWILVRRSAAIALGGPLGRPMLAGLLAAAVGAGAVLWPARQLARRRPARGSRRGDRARAALHDDLRRGAAAGPAAAVRRALGAPSAAGRAGELIMKIAQVLSASTGGIGRHVASIAPRMRDRGHQVRIFCPEVTARAQRFADLGLEVLPLTSLAGPPVPTSCTRTASRRAATRCRWPRSSVRRWSSPGTTPCSARAARPGPRRMLQRLVARGADLTLGASSDLVAEALRLGARRARLAPVAAPALRPRRSPRGRTSARLGARRRTTAGAHREPAGAAEEPGMLRRCGGRGPGPGRPAVRGRRRGAGAGRRWSGGSPPTARGSGCSVIATTCLRCCRRRPGPADLDLGGPRAGRPGGAAGRPAAGQHPGRRHRRSWSVTPPCWSSPATSAAAARRLVALADDPERRARPGGGRSAAGGDLAGRGRRGRGPAQRVPDPRRAPEGFVD